MSKTLDDLKINIEREVRNIKPDVLKSIFLNFRKRLNLQKMYHKIMGFNGPKDSATIKKANPERNWDGYTTIGEGFKFAKSNKISKYFIESYNYNCVERTKKNLYNLNFYIHFLFVCINCKIKRLARIEASYINTKLNPADYWSRKGENLP